MYMLTHCNDLADQTTKQRPMPLPQRDNCHVELPRLPLFFLKIKSDTETRRFVTRIVRVRHEIERRGHQGSTSIKYHNNGIHPTMPRSNTQDKGTNLRATASQSGNQRTKDGMVVQQPPEQRMYNRFTTHGGDKDETSIGASTIEMVPSTALTYSSRIRHPPTWLDATTNTSEWQNYQETPGCSRSCSAEISISLNRSRW